jgi:hypothetical protein
MILWLALLCAVAVFTSAWAWWHKPTWISVAGFVPLIVFIFLTGGEIVGTPKPLVFEWRATEGDEVEIIAFRLREGVAIYLWVEGIGNAPRAYTLPWNDDNARSLHEATREANRMGRTVIGNLWRHNSLEERDQLFYPAPIQPPQIKQ